MSAYNPDKQNQHDSSKCRADGCFLLGTLSVDNAPWACRYHAWAPMGSWRAITEVLQKNRRMFRLLKAVYQLRCDEFDEIQKTGNWAVDDLIKPVPGECHSAWTYRVHEAVDRVLKSKVAEAVEYSQRNRQSEGQSVSAAVKMLTDGSLLKKSGGTK